MHPSQLKGEIPTFGHISSPRNVFQIHQRRSCATDGLPAIARMVTRISLSGMEGVRQDLLTRSLV